MGKTLIGVIVGALIASIGPLLTISYNYKRWQGEQQTQRLKEKRGNLEKLFAKILTQFKQGAAMVEPNFDTEFCCNVDFLLPDNVSKVVKTHLTDDPKPWEEIEENCYDILVCMKAELKNIDDEIDKILSQKHSAWTLFKSLVKP